jgi:hypothetical protein
MLDAEAVREMDESEAPVEEIGPPAEKVTENDPAWAAGFLSLRFCHRDRRRSGVDLVCYRSNA